jgi:hypothetical protein
VPSFNLAHLSASQHREDRIIADLAPIVQACCI